MIQYSLTCLKTGIRQLQTPQEENKNNYLVADLLARNNIFLAIGGNLLKQSLGLIGLLL